VWSSSKKKSSGQAPPNPVLLHPDQYAAVSPPALLRAAAHGYVGIDQRFLRAVLDRFEEFLPELVRAGLEDSDAPTRLEDNLIALFRFRPRAEALPFLVGCVQRQLDDVPDQLLDALCRLGVEAVGPLLELYEELGPIDGAEVAFVLAALQVRDPRILRLLLERLREDPADGSFLLGVNGDPAALPELQKALDAEDGLLTAAAAELRYAIDRLNEPEPAATLDPYDIWSEYPEEAGPRFDLLTAAQLLPFLECPWAEFRREAIESLDLEEREDEAVRQRVLDLALKDPEPAVRGKAWEALRGFTDRNGIGAAMMERLRDAEAPIVERCGALLGLSFTDDPEVHRRILEFYEKPEARAAALEAMWRTSDASFAPFFSRHLDDPDVELQRQAITGVGFLRMHAEAGRLEKFFENGELRTEALFAYASTVPGKVTALHARQVFAKIEDLAGGLTLEEADLVKSALDHLLQLHGRKPVFSAEDAPDELDPPVPEAKAGRNEPCPCGSGKKFKKCCGA
jgi:HEAT repeat protein